MGTSLQQSVLMRTELPFVKVPLHRKHTSQMENMRRVTKMMTATMEWAIRYDRHNVYQVDRGVHDQGRRALARRAENLTRGELDARRT